MTRPYRTKSFGQREETLLQVRLEDGTLDWQRQTWINGEWAKGTFTYRRFRAKFVPDEPDFQQVYDDLIKRVQT